MQAVHAATAISYPDAAHRHQEIAIARTLAGIKAGVEPVCAGIDTAIGERVRIDTHADAQTRY